ncbi:MAG: glycine betaine ABC transporter substrate-binding protein [Bacillota bacterium]
MHQKRWTRTAASTIALLLTLVLLAACGGSTSNAPSGTDAAQKPAEQPAAKPKEVIKLADMQWQSLWINNAVVKFILEKGYGYPVETVEMTTPIMQQAIIKGDVHVVTEMWTGNIIDWYNESVSSGKLLDLGIVMDRASQGWYVPAYVVRGDEKRGIRASAPDLKTVADLKKYPTLFADPEEPSKGLLINCITGWQCAKINRIKLKAYGLDTLYNVQEPGASAALDAAIAGAYKQGKPFLAYYWEPTWLVGTYDLILLEEPEFNAECNAEIQKALKDELPLEQVTAKAGCAYENAKVTKAAHPGLKERAPEVVAFLEKMLIKTDDLNKVSAYMEQEKAEAEDAARYFFQNYPQVWKSWLPADVAQKVEAALK